MLKDISKIIAEFLPGVPFGVCSVTQIGKPHSTRLEKNGLNTAFMFAFPYKVKDEAPKNISRYAAVGDYHEIIIPKLRLLAEKLAAKFKDYTFKAYADYSPILEVEAASRAGLGVIGKNGLLINKDYGSFVFLGEILCDIPFEDKGKIDTCEDCGLCAASCPVGLKKEKCVSLITQKKGELTAAEKEQIRGINSCFGCDVCQNVCPKNKTAKSTFLEEFLLSYKNEFVPNEDSKKRAYNWRGKEVPIRNYNILEEK